MAKTNTADTPAKKAGPPSNTIYPKAYVEVLSRLIYLWGWPLVNTHNRCASFSELKEPMYAGGVLPIAPPNRLCMLTDYIRPEQRSVACPNQDVVYGVGNLDLRNEPVVAQVPDFGDRFWVYQVCDLHTDSFADMGKMYQTKPGFYLIAGADWSGTVPDGITEVFRCPTKRGLFLPRVFQTDDPSDKQAVQPMVSGIAIYPLSEFDGKMKITDWTKTASTPPEESGGSGEMKWVEPEKFFDVLPEVLNETPPYPGEEALYAQIQGLLEAINAKPDLKKAAVEAAANAEESLVKPLLQFVNIGYPVSNNWTTQSNGAGFGFDYLTRTSCARANIFVNKPNETKYFYQDLDSNGARLDGSNQYTVTFLKGKLPPVKGFWSLTMYSKEHFFVPNDLNRYSLGTKNKNLQFNEDGSLTFYVQKIAPEESKRSNWLPAPEGPFSLYIRCYWPDQSVLDDEWTPPPVVKI